MVTRDGLFKRTSLLFRPFQGFGIVGDFPADAVNVLKLAPGGGEVVASNRKRGRSCGRPAHLLPEHFAQALDSLLRRDIAAGCVRQADNRVAHLLRRHAAFARNLEQFAL